MANYSSSSRRLNTRRLMLKLRLAPRMVWIVILLQGAMLLTLFVTRPHPLTHRIRFAELLWAWMHQPAFYPLVALLVGGPILSVMALTMRGQHRVWLAVAWAIFGVLIYVYFPDRAVSMTRSLYESMTR